MGAPSEVTPKQLRELSIRVIPQRLIGTGPARGAHHPTARRARSAP